MDKSSFFSAMGSKQALLSLLVILVVLSGYAWWQSGFTLDISRFFAADVTVVINSAQPLTHTQRVSVSWSARWADKGCTASAWINTGGSNEGTATSAPINACAASKGEFDITCCDSGDTCATGTGSFDIDTSSCPTTVQCGDGTCEDPENGVSCPADCASSPASSPATSPSPASSPTGGGPSGACAGFTPGDPNLSGTDVNSDGIDDIYVCIKQNTFGDHFDRESSYRGAGPYVYKVGIENHSPSGLSAKTGNASIFYCPFATDGAIDQNSGPGCTTVGAAGVCSGCTGDIAPGSGRDVTYTFTAGEDCGTYQIDSSWNPYNTFVLGKVVNTGVDCAAPSIAASPTLSPTTSPTTSPSTSPSSSPTTSPSESPVSDLSCSTSVRSVSVGEPATFTATGGTGSYEWYAPGAGPDGGLVQYPGNPLIVGYLTPGFKTVTVVSGNDQAVCSVTVRTEIDVSPSATPSGEASPSATPSGEVSPSATPSGEVSPSATPSGGVSPSATPSGEVSPSASPSTTVSPSTTTSPSGSPAAFRCEPSSQSVSRNEYADVRVIGAQGTVSWSAPDGQQRSGTCGATTSCEVRYSRTGTYQVTVTDTPTGGSTARSASCTVRVTGGGGPNNYTHLVCVTNACVRINGRGTNECSSDGAVCSPASGARLSLEKLVRNVTQGSAEQSLITARPANTVEFALKVWSIGGDTATSVTVRDALPAGLTYIPGSTTIDGVAAADGVISTGLSLGNIASGRAITVRFRATLAPASFFSLGTTTLSNIGYARASNAAEVADAAFISVVQTSGTPTLSLTKTGLNETDGDTAESSLVRALPAHSLGFVLRVRNATSRTLTDVVLRDVLPSTLELIPGTVRIGTASASDTLTAAGTSLGTMAPGQEIIVRFSALVAPSSELPSGTTTIINTATVVAAGEATITAQLPIVIMNGLVVPSAATGPGDATVLALIISAIITLLYIGYTSTEAYRRHEAGDIAREAGGNNPDFRT